MYIEDLDEVVTARNQRKLFERLLKAAMNGSVGTFTIALEGDQINVWTVISADAVRFAIAAECRAKIAELEHKMMDLGVQMAPKLVSSNPCEKPCHD